MLEKNIESLIQNKYNWFAEAQQKAFPKFIIKEDEKTSYFENENGKILCVKDEYQSNESLNPHKKQAIFVIGIHSIDEIKTLYRNKHKNSILIIIEPKMGFFENVLHNRDLSFLAKENIFVFVDEQLQNLQNFLDDIMRNLNYMGLFKNSVVYFTEYYREFDVELMQKLLNNIKINLRLLSLSIGNSALDSLQGLEQNMENLKYLSHSKNPSKLKDKFKDYPAVIVAAGPSLSKNIQYLKEYQHQVVIVAVDTILEKLLNEGITPNFVCSVERVPEVYDYFYKDKVIPKDTVLVGPLLLDPRIFENYSGEMIIPFRTEVNEYVWLQQMLEIKEDVSTPVGLSCAHMAFGIAQHLGCSPIILTGQDLAYDMETGSSHVTGTYYDEDKQVTKDDSTDELVEGYYGNKVKTTRIWMAFKKWFEVQILDNHLDVINATEGGAKIFHTKQMPLKEVLQKNALFQPINVFETIQKVSNYYIDVEKASTNLKGEYDLIQAIQNTYAEYFNELSKWSIDNSLTQKEKLKINTHLEKVHDMIRIVAADKLLLHNSQALLAEFMWSYQDIEDYINVENLQRKLRCVGRLTASLIATTEEMKKHLKIGIESLVL